MVKITLFFLIFITFMLAVPLLSQSSYAQPEDLPLPGDAEFVVTCCLEAVDPFCLPKDVEGFLDYMALCRKECEGQIDDVTVIPCFPGKICVPCNIEPPTKPPLP